MMRTNRLFIRVLSALALAMFVAGGVSAQKHGRGGGRGGDRDDRGGWGEKKQKHDRDDRGKDRGEGSGQGRPQWTGGDNRGKDRGDRGERSGHGQQRWGEDRRNRRDHGDDGGQWRQQRQHQVDQWRNAQRQQSEVTRQQQQQWRNTQRQQQWEAPRQQQQQWRNAQRRQQWEITRQQQQQWRDAQRQQHTWRDARRQQQHQDRSWDDTRRESRRARREQQRRFHTERQEHQEDRRGRRDQWRQNAEPQRELFRRMREGRGLERHRGDRTDRDDDRRYRARQYALPRMNFNPVRPEQYRERVFDGERMRPSYREERYAERDFWRDQRPEQRIDSDYSRRADGSARLYNYAPRPEVWFGDDYSDFARYSHNTVYTPSYPTYDAGYSSYPDNTPYSYNDDLFGGFESDGFDWKSLLFRSVISAFFSNGDNIGYLDPSPDYASSYDDDGDFGYIPQYSYQAPYYSFGSTPTYAYYEPAAYYGYDQYADATIPAEYVPEESLPISDMVDIYSGGFAGEFIQRALGNGYYQGLLEGQMAREQGWDDEYYSDPYLYQQALYDPYSSSMGNCRRYMSEGYEMGFQDALAGRDEFDLSDSGGDIDLVSLLLGSALSLRG